MSLPQPDLGVLRKAQRGDERAFAIIVRTYEQPVFNYGNIEFEQGVCFVC